jgi:hypothetical protein
MFGLLFCWFAGFSLVWCVAVLEMKNGIFWDITQCGSCKNHRQEPQGLTSEKTPFFSHRRENLKSYIVSEVFIITGAAVPCLANFILTFKDTYKNNCK